LGYARLVGGNVRLDVLVDTVEDEEAHLLVQPSQELPDGFSALGVRVFLQEAGVDSLQAEAADVVERRGDERGDILFVQRSPQRNVLGQGRLSQGCLWASLVQR
jgi:hypothetical protein